MQNSIRFQISLVMFLQYFIWGSWYVTVGTYLFTNFAADAIQVGSTYANLSLAAIISPFFIGFIADRYCSPHKVLGILHLLGSATLFLLGTVSEFETFWWLILLYTLLYMPTIALANSVSFKRMSDPETDFPGVRVFGTVGWIIAGLIIGFSKIETTEITFYMAAVASLVLGILSFFLSHTPAEKQNNDINVVMGLQAMVLFKKRSFSLFFIASILICIPLAFYYSFTNAFFNSIEVVNAAGIMTLGQVSELVFMLLIPFSLARLGIKKMLLMGMLAWMIRYLFFAFGDTGQNMWMLYAGIILHGICYDFFFVTGQIYVNKISGPSVKTASQGLITFATYGIGMLIGSYVSGFVTERYAGVTNDINGYDWRRVWLFPAMIAGVVAILFALFFREKKYFRISALAKAGARPRKIIE